MTVFQRSLSIELTTNRPAGGVAPAYRYGYSSAQPNWRRAQNLKPLEVIVTQPKLTEYERKLTC